MLLETEKVGRAFTIYRIHLRHMLLAAQENGDRSQFRKTDSEFSKALPKGFRALGTLQLYSLITVINGLCPHSYFLTQFSSRILDSTYYDHQQQ